MSAETPQVVRVPSSKDIETGSGEDVGQSPAEETGPNKFRVMGLIAQAVKRFQGGKTTLKSPLAVQYLQTTCIPTAAGLTCHPCHCSQYESHIHIWQEKAWTHT